MKKTNIQEITKWFLSKWEQEQKPFITHKQNSKEFINETMENFLYEWVNSTFIYTEDIINLLNNVVYFHEVDIEIKEIDATTTEAILLVLIKKICAELMEIGEF